MNLRNGSKADEGVGKGKKGGLLQHVTSKQRDTRRWGRGQCRSDHAMGTWTSCVRLWKACGRVETWPVGRHRSGTRTWCHDHTYPSRPLAGAAECMHKLGRNGACKVHDLCAGAGARIRCCAACYSLAAVVLLQSPVRLPKKKIYIHGRTHW
jgi:hypothetical protein